MKSSASDRFFEKVDRSDGCWNWTGALCEHGYGRFGVDGSDRSALAHRVSYQMHKGQIPDGLLVLHSCDNPRCVNPGHLEVGTQQKNIEDCVARGRHKPPRLTGEDHGRAVLTSGDVGQIRARHANGEKQCDIAKDYGVNFRTVNLIVNRKTWKNQLEK